MRVVLLVYALVLAIGSLQPERLGETHHGLLHRVLHVGCFLLLAVFCGVAFPGRRWVPWIVVACVGFGAGLEFSQHLIYRIGFEWDDLRDDAIGVVGASLFLAKALRRRDAKTDYEW